MVEQGKTARTADSTFVDTCQMNSISVVVTRLPPHRDVIVVRQSTHYQQESAKNSLRGIFIRRCVSSTTPVTGTSLLAFPYRHAGHVYAH